MADIKFKFWLGHIKKMTHAHKLSEIGKIIPQFTDDIIPLQFTGLIDKNGKEVYEGDIVRQINDLCIIQRCIGGFECQHLHELKNGGTIEGSVYNFSYLSKWHCEVTGNIYEK